MSKRDLPIYTVDIETDPFQFGRLPRAFAIGFFDGDRRVSFWGRGCIEKMRVFLHGLPPGIIYLHNGGKFDVLGYLMTWVINWPMRIINRRIVKAQMVCASGFHELRDSYCIMPFALGSYKGAQQKIKIEIWKLEKEHRNKYRPEITEYMLQDCVTLWHLVTGIVSRFGPKLTIGSIAMSEIKAHHDFECLPTSIDSEIRSTYFYGGRVECFKTGIIKGRWKIYDVNSMYPYVMKEYKHPTGLPTRKGRSITDDTFFITARGRNYGAFPVRDKLGINCNQEYGVFSVTRHEWDVAMRHGLFQCDELLECVDFADSSSFDSFVDTYYRGKVEAKINGDHGKELENKFVLNSGYGKFAQAPENYSEGIVTDSKHVMDANEGWKPGRWIPSRGQKWVVWTKPSIDASRYNVATGASITGAARSVLLDAIARSKRPIYCDTDSLICEDLPGLSKSASELGAWKLEAEADTAAVAKKKLYAFFVTKPAKVKKLLEESSKIKQMEDGSVCVKLACKGVRVTPEEMLRICRGEVITSRRDAPSFHLNGTYSFIERRVKM